VSIYRHDEVYNDDDDTMTNNSSSLLSTCIPTSQLLVLRDRKKELSHRLKHIFNVTAIKKKRIDIGKKITTRQ